jgi:hypothetical protein
VDFDVVSRAEWGAKGVQSRHGRMKLPVSAVTLHHTVTPTSINPAKDMRVVEQVGMKRFGQFSYSYCAHSDGTVLEGAGRMVGAHTAGRNSTSFGIALIGNYDERGVTVWQIDAVRQLIAWLIDNGDLTPGVYPTAGHRDIVGAKTACPGEKAYRLMDAFRVPWDLTKGMQMTDSAELHNIEGPLQFQMLQDGDGNCTGYAIFSTKTGELHGYGPGWRYFGRSEDPTPG